MTKNQPKFVGAVNSRNTPLPADPDPIPGRNASQQSFKERSKLQALASELTLAEHRERQRVAQKLHDGLMQILVAAKLKLGLVARGKEAGLEKEILAIAALMDSAIEASRWATDELSPPVLHEFGLVPALEWLARWMRSCHGLEVSLKSELPGEPPGEVITVLFFQIIREFLLNIVAHGSGREVHLEITWCDHLLQAVIDNPIADFDPAHGCKDEQALPASRLKILLQRLELLDGVVESVAQTGRDPQIRLLAARGRAVKNVRMAL